MGGFPGISSTAGGVRTGGYRRSRADSELIAQLTRDLAAAKADALDWRREWEMYSRAWLRELGGKVINKAHRIDALVLTTRWFRESQEKWCAETARLATLRSDLATARTIGLPLEPIIAAHVEDDATGRRGIPGKPPSPTPSLGTQEEQDR